MTKLQFLKIFMLNLIFGATVIAGDLPEEVEPKRLRATVVRIDPGFELPTKGAVCVAVPRKFYEEMLLDEKSDDEDGDSKLLLAKRLRITHEKSDDERTKQESISFIIPSMDEPTRLSVLMDAIDKGHQDIARQFCSYCANHSLLVALGHAKAKKRSKIQELILNHLKNKGVKMSTALVRFHLKNAEKTSVPDKVYAG